MTEGPRNPSMLITREGEIALRAELERLREEAEVQFPLRFKEARESGDSGSNDEYLQIAEEEAVLATRISNLEALLETAEVVDEPGDGPIDTVALGTIVELKFADSEKVTERRLLGAFERIGSDGISVASPMGQALLGRREGETVTVELPNGRTRTLEIVSVKTIASPDADTLTV